MTILWRATTLYESITKKMLNTQDKISSFASYGDGWNYGEGKSFNHGTISSALNVLKAVTSLALYKTDAFPGLNGQILITIYHQSQYYVEISVESDGTFSYLEEENDSEVTYIEELTYLQLASELHKFARKIWNALGSLSEFISTKIKVDSPVLPLNPQVTEAVSPLLASVVFSTKEKVSVTTLESSTSKDNGNHIYSGGSLPTYYPMAAS